MRGAGRGAGSVPVVAGEVSGERRVRKPQDAREANASRLLPAAAEPAGAASSAAWPAA